jgi:hypothetical protein
MRSMKLLLALLTLTLLSVRSSDCSLFSPTVNAAVSSQLTPPWDAACQVVVLNPERGWWLWSSGGPTGGSGTLIGLSGDYALVLTVQHVAEEVGAVAVCNWVGNPPLQGTVLAVNAEADIALLMVKAPVGIKPVPVATATKESAPFTMAGYPGYDRTTLRLQTGEFLEIDDGTLTVKIRPEKGMSGGPCFDRYGNVCGAVSTFSRREYKGTAGGGSQALKDLVSPYIKIQE